jgi:hypothetical protein
MPIIKRKGNAIHPRNTIAPPKIIKISTKRPKTIKTTRIIAPIIRENKLETKTSKYLPKENPRG